MVFGTSGLWLLPGKYSSMRANESYTYNYTRSPLSWHLNNLQYPLSDYTESYYFIFDAGCSQSDFCYTRSLIPASMAIRCVEN